MSPDTWQFSSDPSTTLFVVLMAAMLFIGLWTALSRAHVDNLVAMGRPIVDNLFLRVGIKTSRGTKQEGYVRSLGVHRATLVVRGDAPTKGDIITLDLSTLPNFPKGDALTSASVRRVEALDAGSSLVTVRFGAQPTLETLASYVVALARSTGRYSHA